MKRKKCGLVADNYGMDMNDSRLKGEFDLWLEDKKRSKCQSLKSSYNKICGKCGQAFSPSRIEQHEAKCGNLANEVLCTENHEHQYIDKAFDAMEDAVAFFYDNEYDSELNIRGTNTRRTPRRPRRFVHFLCARSTPTTKRPIKYGSTRTKQLDHKCPAHVTIVENSQRVSGNKTTGRRFNRTNFGLSFGLKNGLRFRFDSETCPNYPFLNIFLV